MSPGQLPAHPAAGPTTGGPGPGSPPSLPRGLPPELRVLRELGRGSQTVVYEVTRHDTRYALKLLVAGTASPPGAALRAFRREAALMASVDHPGLPRIHALGDLDGHPYLVMDLVEGGTLADLLARGRMEPVEAIRVAFDVADALAALHRRGLVHRDVKPLNVMLVEGGGARLIDLGLATRAATAEDAAGTFVYASPEQSRALRRPVDHRSDLYSLGVVLFECLTGRPPFRTGDLGTLLRMHVSQPAPDVRSIVPDVPDTVAVLVGTLLAKDPDDRYQHTEDLVTDLGRLLADPHAAFVPGRRPDQDPHRTEPPLYGRDRELQRLLAPLAGLRSGRGGAVLVHGPSGSGKSRLVRELTATARGRGLTTLHGTSSPGDPLPLAPLRQAVDVPRLPAGREVTGDAEIWLDGARGDATETALADLLVDRAGSAGGTVLHLDNVQWLDQATLQVLRALAPRLRETPLLVVATARDDDEHLAAAALFRDAVGDTLALDLPLGELDEQGVAALVASHLPGVGQDADLVRALALRGSGNPFAVQEYLHAVVDAGLLLPSWGRWLLDEEGLASLDLPEDALGLVLARISALGPDSHRHLAVGAVIGARFRAGLVAATCGTEVEHVLQTLAEAERHRLIEPQGTGEHVFLHDRVREALLDDLDPRDLGDLHRRIAKALDGGLATVPPDPAVPSGATRSETPTVPGDAGPQDPQAVYAVAHHYVLGGTPEDADRIRETCTAAGVLALHEGSPAQAAAFLEQAAAVGARPEPGFLRAWGEALRRSGSFAAATRRLEDALTIDPTSLGRAATMAQLALVTRDTWDAEGTLRWVDRGLRELGCRVPRNGFSRALVALGTLLAGLTVGVLRIGLGSARGAARRRYELITALNQLGAYAGALDLSPAALVRHNCQTLYPALRLGGGHAYTTSLPGLGLTTAMLGLRRASEWCFRGSAREAAALAEPKLTATADWFRAFAAYMTDRDDGEQLASTLREHGRWLDPGLCDDTVASLAWEALATGRTAEGVDWYERGLRHGGSPADREVTSLVTTRSVTLAATGQAAEAAAELHRVRELLRTHQGTGLRLHLLMTELFLLLEQSELGEPFDRVAAAIDSLRLRPSRTMRQYRIVWLLLALGRAEQARLAGTGRERDRRRTEAGAALRRLSAAPDVPLLRAGKLLVSAQLALVDGSAEQALDLLSGIRPVSPDAPLLDVEVACTRARALAALGHPDAARRQVRLALDIAGEARWPHRIRRVRVEFGVMTSGRAEKTGSGRTAFGPGVERLRLQAVEAVSRAAARVVEPDALARITLDETIRILAADRAFLFLAPPTTGTGPCGSPKVVPYLGRDAAGRDVADLTGYSSSLVDRVAATGEALVMTGTEEGAALGAESVVLHGLRSVLAAPLQLEGRLLGVVYLDSQVAKGIFTEDDVGILTALTDSVAASLETARAAQLEVSVQAARRQRDLAELLHEALVDMSASVEPGEILDRLPGGLRGQPPPARGPATRSGRCGVPLAGRRRDG